MYTPEFYRLLVENIPAVTWVTNRDGHTSYISPNVESVYGFTQQEIYDGGTDLWFHRIHPNDRERVEKAYKKMFTDDAEFSIEYKIQHKNGKWLWFSDKAVRRYTENGYDFAVGFFTDITENKAVKQELTQTHLRLEQLVSTSTDWLWEFDENTIFTYSSPGIKNLLGYEPEEVIGKSAFDLIPSPEKERVAEAFAEIAKDRLSFSNLQNANQHKDGRIIEIESSGSPIFDEEGNFRGYRGIDRNISERKRLEAQKIHAQKMEAVGTLAAGIAHDFNNTLTAIMGFTELAQLEVADGNQVDKHLSEIYKASTRARDLVQQILFFSRNVEHKKEVVPLAPMVNEALSFIRATIPSSIEVTADIRNKDSAANVDSTQLYQVMINLCTNAAQALKSHGGSGEIHVSLTESRLSKQTLLSQPHLADTDYILISVSDNGPGIDPATLPRIFDPYFTTKPINEGTGLGLSIVHGVVKNHDGLTTVDNRPGEGVTFNIFIPKSRVPGEETGASHSENAPCGSEHILFVDDETSIIASTAVSLEKLGYKVTAISDSRTALSALESTPEAFDLLITDQTMPNLTGNQLAAEAKKLREDIPVIICSGYHHLINELQEAELGVDHFLKKPVTRSTLAQTIRAALGKDQSEY